MNENENWNNAYLLGYAKGLKEGYERAIEDESKLLLPCPFCGGRAKVEENKDAPSYGVYHVYCRECYAEIERCNGEKEKAIEAWNRRVKK